MKHPDYCFVDTAFGSPNLRNNPMRIGDVPRAMPKNASNCHCTWHRFPQAYMDHYQQNWMVRDGKKYQSTAKYLGPSYADFLPFDIDSDSLLEAQSVAREFLARLESDFNIRDGVYCWFSGSKGFHILIASSVFGGWEPSPLLAGNLKKLAVRLAGDVKIDTAVYDKNRLWRIPNTVNKKSGLHKIPLTIGEIVEMPLEAILDKAKAPRKMSRSKYDDAPIVEGAVVLWQAVQSEKLESKAKPDAGQLFDTALREGQQRDVRAFEIARRLRDFRVPPGMALEILKLWDANLEEPLTGTDGADVLEKKIQNAYGDVTAEGSRITLSAIRGADELAEDYDAYVQLIKQRQVTLGVPTIDKHIRGIAPGEVCTVIAKTGVGKTVFGQNMLVHVAAKHDTHSLFCSMEQPKAQVFERFAQMSMGREGREIESGWGDSFERLRIIEAVRERLLDKVWTIDVPHLRFEEIEDAKRLAEEKSGETIGLLVIDYMGLMDAKALDRSLYGQISEAARQMKTLAKQLSVAVVVLCQVARSTADSGDLPLNISSARESGAIEESADFMIGLYRPNILKPEGKPDDTMMVQILKNRKGQTGIEVECVFDGARMRIGEREKFQRHEGNGQVQKESEENQWWTAR